MKHRELGEVEEIRVGDGEPICSLAWTLRGLWDDDRLVWDLAMTVRIRECDMYLRSFGTMSGAFRSR